MASRPDDLSARPRRHKRNAQWRRDRRPRPSSGSLQAALAVLPSLPRPMLVRLTARMIDRLDEMDGDLDREPEPVEANGDEADAAWREAIRAARAMPASVRTTKRV